MSLATWAFSRAIIDLARGPERRRVLGATLWRVLKGDFTLPILAAREAEWLRELQREAS